MVNLGGSVDVVKGRTKGVISAEAAALSVLGCHLVFRLGGWGLLP